MTAGAHRGSCHGVFPCYPRPQMVAAAVVSDSSKPRNDKAEAANSSRSVARAVPYCFRGVALITSAAEAGVDMLRLVTPMLEYIKAKQEKYSHLLIYLSFVGEGR